MLGLSLGSWIGGKWISYLKNKTNLSAIIFYGLTEIIIGLGAFAVPQLFTIDARLLLPLGEINSFQYLLLSALVLGLSIFPFCFAMGVTYPFMMEFIQELKWEERTSFSYLYLANGVGAMFGTIMTALFLVEKLGFSKTLMFGAFGNFSIALICLSKGFYKIPPSNIEKPLFPKIIVAMETWLLNNKSRTYLVLFVTGLTSLAMEVTWIRGFTPVLKTTIYTFATILATYLFSMLLGSQWYRRDLIKKKTTPTLKLIGACFLFAFFPIFLSDPRIHPTITLSFISHGSLLVSSAILLMSILPICTALGYLTPKLIDQVSQGNPVKAGRAYAINIFGGILGPLLASYFLIPMCGIKSTLILLAIPYGILFLYSTNSNEISKLFKSIITITGIFVTIISVFLIIPLELSKNMGKGGLVLRDSTATVVAFGEGMKKRLLVNGIGITDGEAHVFVNSSPIAFFDIIPDTVSIIYPTAFFIADTASIEEWYWNFDHNPLPLEEPLDSSSAYQFEHTFPDSTGIYQITLSVVDKNGCSATTFNPLIVKDKFWIYLPNSFTPDMDGINDLRTSRSSQQHPGSWHLLLKRKLSAVTL